MFLLNETGNVHVTLCPIDLTFNYLRCVFHVSLLRVFFAFACLFFLSSQDRPRKDKM